MKWNLQPFFDGEGLTGGGTVTPLPSAKPEKFDDDTDLLNNLLDTPGDNKTPKVKEDKEDDEEELITDEDAGEEDEEDKEDDEDKKEEDEEEEDEPDLLVESNRSIDFKKIKDKFPDFAKTPEFRELRNAVYRESKFTELFPTVEDAEEAAENNTTFNRINESVIGKGDSTVLLQAIKEASPDSLKKFASGFLDQLSGFDRQLYGEVLTPVVKQLARQIAIKGQQILRAKGNEDEQGQALLWTAKNISQFYFDDEEAINREEPKEDPKIAERRKELDERENKILQQNFNAAFGTCVNAVDRQLHKLVLDGLDPNGRLNEFTRESLVEKILNDVRGQLDKDKNHIRRMDSLWNRARSDEFSRDSLSRIVSAYLERAKPVLAASRAKYKTIAFKDKRERDNENEPVRIPNRGASGRPAHRDGRGASIRGVDPKKIDYKNTSDEDILNGKVKLKG